MITYMVSGIVENILGIEEPCYFNYRIQLDDQRLGEEDFYEEIEKACHDRLLHEYSVGYTGITRATILNIVNLTNMRPMG